jgi:hypothetical protein
VDYLKKNKFERELFEEACGVGVVVTEEEIRAAVLARIEENRE